MGRRVDARRVKTHRSYTIEQLAVRTGRTVGTVRRWIKLGLPCQTDTRPFLIQGSKFKIFHAQNLAKKTKTLADFEAYCVGCKEPRMPQSGLVDFEPMDATRARIMAICPVCERMMRRIVRQAQLRKWAMKFGFATNMREDA